MSERLPDEPQESSTEAMPRQCGKCGAYEESGGVCKDQCVACGAWLPERKSTQAAASEGREPDGSLAEDVLAAFCALLDEKDNGAEHTAESMTGRIMDVITPHLGECCSLRQSAAPSAQLEERRTRAKQWAEDHKERTGGGPGTPGYINAYMCGYFNHPQVSSKGLTAAIIEQFEAATLAQESQTGAVLLQTQPTCRHPMCYARKLCTAVAPSPIELDQHFICNLNVGHEGKHHGSWSSGEHYEWESKTGAATKLEDGGAMGSHTILSKLD